MWSSSQSLSLALIVRVVAFTLVAELMSTLSFCAWTRCVDFDGDGAIATFTLVVC
jgi:hypothetical protein